MILYFYLNVPYFINLKVEDIRGFYENQMIKENIHILNSLKKKTY